MTQHDPVHVQAEHLGDERPPRRTRPRRASALAIAGVVIGSVAVGGWAATGRTGDGGRPADVIPATAVAYVGVDLDPAAGQKVEALRMAGEFPALRTKLGLPPGGDLRRWLFRHSGLDRCEGVDYEHDVAPWIGDRAGFALLPGGRAHPVLALAVRDTDRAREVLTRLVRCAAEERAGHRAFGHGAGFAVADDHVVLAESTQRAERTVEEAGEAALSDDASFRRWTERAGPAGVVSGYLSAKAPQTLVDGSPFGSFGDPLPEFRGLGAVLRFADGELELEVATAGLPPVLQEVADGADIQDLPEGTGAAMSAALRPGWARHVLDMVGGLTGMPPRVIADAAEAGTGLELPADAERLLGESVSLAVDASPGRASRVGARVVGEPREVVQVARRLSVALDEDRLVTASGSGVVALGHQAAYVRDLVRGGSLGQSARFRSAVPPQADRASLVTYADFDHGTWATALLAELHRVGDHHGGRVDTEQLQADLAPLDTLGAAVWNEHGVQRGLLRITTD